MKKSIKIILSAIGITILLFVLLYFLSTRGSAPTKVIPEPRTLYTGYVKIEPVDISELKIKLEQQGCHAYDYKGETSNKCKYQETTVPFDKKDGLIIYPHGFGWGPLSFYLTNDTLWDTKDIPGSPNPEKFKLEVRRDVNAIGNMVQIKEDSWKITETKYPFNVIY